MLFCSKAHLLSVVMKPMLCGNVYQIREIEIKNIVTIARGEWGGDRGERGLQELLQRTQGQNQGGGWRWGREVGLARVGWRDGEKMQTIVTE